MVRVVGFFGEIERKGMEVVGGVCGVGWRGGWGYWLLVFDGPWCWKSGRYGGRGYS